jgi:omega-amidase
MNDLRITLIQSIQHWHDPEANRKHFAEKISQASETDLVVLPEMFTTGFTMQADMSEDWQGGHAVTLEWMKDLAASQKIHLCGSIAVREEDKRYNRLLWVRPDGQWFQYDKRHLFSMAGETDNYSGGNEKLTVEIEGWKVRPLICYDLRFPVWSRNRLTNGDAEYDVLLYTANWPVPRIEAWKTLLHARAIENACYVAGVNRVGKDGNGMEYSGDSCICDFKGQTLVHSKEDALLRYNIEYASLMEYRQKFPVLKDADDFVIS